MNLKFEILGKPMAKARPRLSKSGFAYTPAKTVNYENLVRYTFQREFPLHIPFENNLEVYITAIFEIPKSYSKKKKKELLETHDNYNHKPDVDNISKIILDSLNGIAYKDDSLITILHVNKEYGLQPKVIVEIKEVV